MARQGPLGWPDACRIWCAEQSAERAPGPWRTPRSSAERTQQLARIGNNLNQIARWANTHKGAAEAVEVLARLVAIERALTALARFESPDRDAH